MTQPQDEPNAEEMKRVSQEVGNRLEELGIWLSGTEQPEDLALLIEAVERFETAVQTRGGDLMVDEGPVGKTAQPDNVNFSLPQRRSDESVDRYIDRLERARSEVLRHPATE